MQQTCLRTTRDLVRNLQWQTLHTRSKQQTQALPSQQQDDPPSQPHADRSAAQHSRHDETVSMRDSVHTGLSELEVELVRHGWQVVGVFMQLHKFITAAGSFMHRMRQVAGHLPALSGKQLCAAVAQVAQTCSVSATAASSVTQQFPESSPLQ